MKSRRLPRIWAHRTQKAPYKRVSYIPVGKTYLCIVFDSSQLNTACVATKMMNCLLLADVLVIDGEALEAAEPAALPPEPANATAEPVPVLEGEACIASSACVFDD